MPIHQDGMGQRPQMFRWLQLRGIGWQEEQVDVVRHTQALGAVPACAIQHQHDLPGWAGSDRESKGRQFGLKAGTAHGGRQMKDRSARGRMYKTHEIAPRVAMLHGSQGALPVETPDFVQNRLEPNPMFIHRPQLDGGVREGGSDLTQERAQSRLEGCLRHGVSLHMMRAWLEEACAHAP
jgi:hypothetical protein